MRNYDLSPCCVNGSVLTNWPAPCKPPVKAKASRPITHRKKSDDNHYRITLALAGFRQEDLDIQLEGTRLVVKGTPQQAEKETTWLHRGW